MLKFSLSRIDTYKEDKKFKIILNLKSFNYFQNVNDTGSYRVTKDKQY